MTWADLRAAIWRTLLLDTGVKYAAPVMRDALWFALDAFCAHTAQATSTSVEITEPGAQSIMVPENLFEQLDRGGSVYVVRGQDITYLRPINFQTNATSNPTFRVWGQRMDIDYALKAGDTLCIDYYAYYNHPYADTDTVDVPSWATAAISYLTAVHALSGRASKQTNIAQFRTVEDRGTPEQNSDIAQQRHFTKMYESEIHRVPRQNRTVRLK